MDLFGAAVSIVFGLVVGSFLSVVVHRVPRRTFFSAGARSRCPHCGAQILWHDNLPILSFVLLRGRARCCKAPISIRYPIIEGLTAIAFWLVYLFHTRSSTAGSVPIGPVLLDLYLVASIIAASAIDLEHRILPDPINFMGIGVGLLGSVLVPSLHEASFLHGWVSTANQTGVAFLASALGLLCGAGSLYLVALLGRKFYGREAMGLGDVKFMAFTGTFIGAEGVLVALIAACALGAVIGVILAICTGDPLIPFGPFLAVGVLLGRFYREGAIRLLFEDWPRWLRSDPMAPLVLIGVSLFGLGALFYLRRLRGK